MNAVGALEQLANPEKGGLDDVVDLKRYPIDQPDSADFAGLVADVRGQLVEHGLMTLPSFLKPAALATAASEVASIEHRVPQRTHRATVYHRPDLTNSMSEGDPRSFEMEWRAGHITRDKIPPFWFAHRLYVSSFFKEFVARCVDAPRVFEYADPLAGLVATILPPNGQYPWHYDTNEFVLTIMTQKPAHGGTFQYRKDLRTPGNENLAGLDNVLRGRDESVRTVSTEPGDLQLFLGRYSLHQVTPVRGDTARHVLVFSYADRPGVIGPVDRTRSVYGRVTEAHLLAAERSAEERSADERTAEPRAGSAPDGLIL